MLSITAYLDFVNALYHLVRGFFAPQFGGLLDFQQTSDLGAVHQGDEISSSYSPSCGPSAPSGAGVVSVLTCGDGDDCGADVA